MSIRKSIHKLLVITASIILGTGLLPSCSSDGIELPDPTIDFIQTTKINFEGVAGEEQVIKFKSPLAWVAEVHQTGGWLKATPLHGEAGQAEIKVYANSDNFGTYSRKGTIEIFLNGYQAYSIDVEQKSAVTGDIRIEGNINDGKMTLQSNATGTIFSDTIYVCSTKEWTLEAEAQASEILSFKTHDMAQDGAEKRTEVIVTADYSKWENTSFTGKFYVKTNEGTAVPVTVEALSEVAVYANNKVLFGEKEQTTYEFVDTLVRGTYQTKFYVDANIRWTIHNNCPWIETSADWSTMGEPSNVLKDGSIAKKRHEVTLRVKASELSAEGKTCTLDLTDSRGMTVKTLNLIFAGTGSDYIDYKFSMPAVDVNGNPWAFEARRNTVEEEGPYNRRRISIDFSVITSTDYSSIADAPFHLIMIDGTNGIAHKTEHHWANLEMGDPSEQSKTESGMYLKQLYIVANERGDSDDQNQVTKASESRTSIIYIVPRGISFEDMWTSEGRLQEEYADNLVLVSQKNDPDAEYKFAYEGVPDGSELTINPEGENRTFNVVKGSYDKCDVNIQVLDSDGEWVNSSDCSFTYTSDEEDNILTMTYTFTKNEAKWNPFKKEWVGAPRRFRIQMVAFIGDDKDSKVIYTIYANQDILKE